MIQKLVLHKGFKCQNLTCPNAVGEGTMAVVVVEDPERAKRPLVLLLCAPCAQHFEAD